MKTRAIFRAYALGSKRTAPVGDNRPVIPLQNLTTLTSKLLLNMIGATATFEREIILEHLAERIF